MRQLADRILKLIEGKGLFVKECVRLHEQDGTLGIKESKAADGLGLVQSEASAYYDGMPHSGSSAEIATRVRRPLQHGPPTWSAAA